MANYLTHFSCLLNVGTPENAARALELYNKLSEEGASEEPPSEGFIRGASLRGLSSLDRTPIWGDRALDAP